MYHSVLLMCVHMLCYALCIHVSSTADVEDDLRAQRGELSQLDPLPTFIISSNITS